MGFRRPASRRQPLYPTPDTSSCMLPQTREDTSGVLSGSANVCHMRTGAALPCFSSKLIVRLLLSPLDISLSALTRPLSAALSWLHMLHPILPVLPALLPPFGGSVLRNSNVCLRAGRSSSLLTQIVGLVTTLARQLVTTHWNPRTLVGSPFMTSSLHMGCVCQRPSTMSIKASHGLGVRPQDTLIAWTTSPRLKSGLILPCVLMFGTRLRLCRSDKIMCPQC